MPIFEFFQNIKEKRVFPNSLYKASITQIPKSNKDKTQKRKSQATITDENRQKKFSTKYQQTKYNSILKGPYMTVKWDISQGYKDGSVPASQSM